jgi:5-methylcytosine-specific restriction endonuclease McrA
MVYAPPMPFNDPIKQRAASRRHYEKHRDRVIAKAKEYSKAARNRIRAYITAYLKTNPCVDCGETDAIVLEFDHVAGKDFNISDSVRKGVGMKKLKDEIAKCEVRCSNCHRRKTYERSGLTHKD